MYSEANGSYSNNGVETETRKKKVVLLGTGWAGASFLKTLNNSSYEVQVISPRNYFAFTPLLPSVTCGTVEARSVVEPIRNIGRKVINTLLIMAAIQKLYLLLMKNFFIVMFVLLKTTY